MNGKSCQINENNTPQNSTCLLTGNVYELSKTNSFSSYENHKTNIVENVTIDDANIETVNFVCDSNETEDPLMTTLKDTKVNNPKSLILAQVNINSLKKENKSPLSYFKDILQRQFLDILCVSESKLDESVTTSETDCEPDFKCYRKDRSSLSGGLCVWIRSDIPQQRQTYLEFDSKDNHVESFVIELTIKKEKWCLILAYKNPDVSTTSLSRSYVYKV